MSLSQEQPPSPAMEDAEAQMRRALGLFGDAPKSRSDGGERAEPAQRSGGGVFTQNTHRRRFVQDGEVPVTVVRRDDPASAAPPMGPSYSRLHRVEAALQTESTARERAERALQEAQAAVQALRTKMGHNDLAKNEAVAAAQRDRDAMVGLRAEIAGLTERLQEAEARADEAGEEVRSLRADLTEERRARKAAERLARDSAEQPSLALEMVEYPGNAMSHGEDAIRVPPRRGRPPNVRPNPVEAEEEAEPVKWWLMPAKTAGKRR